MTHEQKPESSTKITRDMLIGHQVRTYRHKARGSLYEVQGLATLQINGEHDMTECVVYLDCNFGRMWVRPVSEFIDGRFEVVAA